MIHINDITMIIMDTLTIHFSPFCVGQPLVGLGQLYRDKPASLWAGRKPSGTEGTAEAFRQRVATRGLGNTGEGMGGDAPVTMG